MSGYRLIMAGAVASVIAVSLAAGAAEARPRRVLVVGDSLSVGRHSYARQLNRWQPTTVIAKSGQQTGWMLDRLKKIDLRQYSHLVLLGGGNDINCRRTVQAIRNISWMIVMAKRQGVKVILVTLPPWKGWPSWTLTKHWNTLRLNQWLAYYRTRGYADGLVDYYRLAAHPYDPQRLHPYYDQHTDHLHPNWRAHRHLAWLVQRAIR